MATLELRLSLEIDLCTLLLDIRNGPQPISNLMSNPNRCCHQLLAHQSLAHRQLLLYQAFP